MAITKARLDYLLNEGYDEEDTVLVHGTSVEAIQMLCNTDYLPSDKTICSDIRKYESCHPRPGLLYFVPIKDAFQNHSMYSTFSKKCTQAWCEQEAAIYARNIQVSQIGYNYCGEYIGMKMLIQNPDLRITSLYSQEILKKIPWNDRQFKRSIHNAKGVLIGLSPKAFELLVERGSDEPEQEVMIHLPQGLHHSYLHYILPLGKTEEISLQKIRETLK